MRRPTPASAALAWHRAAMRGENPPRHDGDPQCGWYRTRLVKGGPFVPVRIFLDRDVDPETGDLNAPEVLVADVDGQRRDPVRLWTYLHPVSREEYGALHDRRRSIPEMAATMAPIDISKRAMTP